MRTWIVFPTALALAGCGADQRGEATGDATTSSPVYRLTPEKIPHGDCDEPSCARRPVCRLGAPEPGWVRSEVEDATGFETTKILAHGSSVTDHNDGPPDVRSGLARFVAQPPELDHVEAVCTRGTLASGDCIRLRTFRSPGRRSEPKGRLLRARRS